LNWSELNVLITGGTGSFGRKFTEIMLRDHHPKKLMIFSRDEAKQHEMRTNGFNHPNLRYFIGDVRDVGRLQRAMEEADVVVHAAALKQIEACEYNPIEAIMTNVMGARNVIDAALETGVRKVLALSTDKAVNPVNLYGATKLCAEKLFVQSNSYAGTRDIRFSCVRYGNVMGSRGSVIPLFKEQQLTGHITVTDPRMTRFWITLEQGVGFVIRCIELMHGGEVFVPKIPSTNIMDLVRAVAPTTEVTEIGIRAGEKVHEVLISEDEARHTLELEDMYVVQPLHSWWPAGNWKNGWPVPEDFKFTSDDKANRLTFEQTEALLKEVV